MTQFSNGEFFTDVTEPVPYQGPDSDEPLAFRWYDKHRVVGTRRWRSTSAWRCATGTRSTGPGSDVFGDRDLRPARGSRRPSTRCVAAKEKMAAAFEFFEKLGRALLVLPRPRHRPDGLVVRGGDGQPATPWSTRRSATWNAPAWACSGERPTCSIHPRYMSGAATNPDPEVFARAAAQVVNCLEATHRMNGGELRAVGRAGGLRDPPQHRPEAGARPARPVPQPGGRAQAQDRLRGHDPAGAQAIQEPTKHQYDHDVPDRPRLPPDATTWSTR